jgi:hypothetical protein
VRSFAFGNVALLIVGVGEFGLMFLLPLVQQAGQGLTPIEAGLVGLPVPVCAVLAFPLVQKLDERMTVVGGLLLEAAGMIAVALTIGAGPLWIVPGLAVYGLGVGAATAQLSALVLADVPASRNGLASGISSAVRQLGSTLGVGLLGAVFSAALDGPLADRPVQTVAQLRARGDETAVAHAADALANGIVAAALVAAAFLVAGAIAIRMQPRRDAHYEGAPAPAAA